MLNEVRARHIKGLIVQQIVPGRSAGAILDFEIAKREDEVGELKAQIGRTKDEIAYLGSLDAKKLQIEAEAR